MIVSPFLRVMAGLLDFFAYSFGMVLFLYIYSNSVDISIIYAVFCFAIYFILLSKGRSIGKFLLGIRVVDAVSGNNIGFIRMFVRETIGKSISSLIFSFGYIMIFFTNEHQGLHDILVHSVVVDFDARGF